MKITGHPTRSVFERYTITDQSNTQAVGRVAEAFLAPARISQQQKCGLEHEEVAQIVAHETQRPN
jgi:hypothetical protein